MRPSPTMLTGQLSMGAHSSASRGILVPLLWRRSRPASRVASARIPRRPLSRPRVASASALRPTQRRYVRTLSKAAMARSRWSGSSAADICTRTRAVPPERPGKPNPVTKTPSSSSRADSAMAAVSPTMIGTIAASPSKAVPGLGEQSAEGTRVLAEPGEELGLLEHELDRAQRAARDRRRQRVREELRPRALCENVAHLLRRSDVPARRAAERLPERSRDRRPRRGGRSARRCPAPSRRGRRRRASRRR